MVSFFKLYIAISEIIRDRGMVKWEKNGIIGQFFSKNYPWLTRYFEKKGNFDFIDYYWYYEKRLYINALLIRSSNFFVPRVLKL